MHMRTSQRSLSASLFFLGLRIKMLRLNVDIVRLFLFSVSYGGIAPCAVDTIMWRAAMTDYWPAAFMDSTVTITNGKSFDRQLVHRSA